MPDGTASDARADQDRDGPLHGLTVGVTSARRGSKLASAFERRGAEVRHGPLLRADRQTDDDTVIRQTDAVIEAAPAWFAASTGKGMQLWAEAAERHDRLEALLTTVADARVVARGAKAVGGLQPLGLEAEFVAPSETDEEVAAWIGERADPDDVVAVQRHGHPTGAFDALVGVVADVAVVTPYRTDLPDDRSAARGLITAAVGGEIDVMAFTSRAAAINLFVLAEEMGAETAAGLHEALSGPVALAVIGPVTAGPFVERGIEPAVIPDRHRSGALVDAVGAWAGARG